MSNKNISEKKEIQKTPVTVISPQKLSGANIHNSACEFKTDWN